jgi:hypothetical protein
MAAKIFCAGFDKNEKGTIEDEVRRVLSQRPASEAWMVSVVKTGGRLAISVDGPDDRLRGKSLVVDHQREVQEKLSLLLLNAGFPVGTGTPAPVSPVAPPAAKARTATATPLPAPPPRTAPAATRPSPPTAPRTTPPPAARSVTPPARPVPALPEDEAYEWESPNVAGERRVTVQCSRCQGRYAVVYESVPNEPMRAVSVACPHCWERDQVEIGENASFAKTYRADKLKA